MQRRNGFWRDAALCGLIIGAVSIAVSFLKALPFAPANIVFSLTELVAIIWCLYKFGKRRAMLGDPTQGYSFGQNMGFVVAVMLVAGFIYGVGEYLQVNFIVSGMVDKVGEEMIERAYRIHGNNAMADNLRLHSWPFRYPVRHAQARTTK